MKGHFLSLKNPLRFMPSHHTQLNPRGHVSNLELSLAVGHSVVRMLESEDESAHPGMKVAEDLHGDLLMSDTSVVFPLGGRTGERCELRGGSSTTLGQCGMTPLL